MIVLLKGMLTKSPLKRILKLSQVKTSDYFKDFNWDNLLSFNMDPPYIINLPNETIKEKGPYIDYINTSLKEFRPSNKEKIDLDYKENVDIWFSKL